MGGSSCVAHGISCTDSRLSVAGACTSSRAGIKWGPACSYPYQTGTVITLTATPSTGSTFTGWSGGGCSGTAPCTLAGNASVTVTATFATGVAVAVNSVAPNQG